MTLSTGSQPDLLPIIIDGHTFAPAANRMWDLNEIHKGLDLPTAKRPGQWDNAIQRALGQSGSFHLAHGGSNPGTWATEAGTIAYAMWVSTDFYLMVVDAFILVRNDSVFQKRVALLALDETNARLATAATQEDCIRCGTLQGFEPYHWVW